jgi:hypothetical protein
MRGKEILLSEFKLLVFKDGLFPLTLTLSLGEREPVLPIL